MTAFGNAAAAADDDGRLLQISYVTVLDGGTFGTVYRAVLSGGGGTARTVAVKRIRSPGGGRHELDAHRRLRHPNVVRLLFHFYSGWDGADEDGSAGRLNLVMELAPTNLDHAIRRLAAAGRTASVDHCKLYAYQMFRGLGYVHETAGLCHRDVKPNNLLLYPVTGALKLCDFGSAKDLLDGRPNTRYACSRRYRAPELLFDQLPDAPDYTAAVDVWSAGCVYYELMTGAPLFPGTSVPHQRALVARPPAFPGWAPADAVRLVVATLRFDPTARPTALEACDHECFDVLRRPGGHRLPPLFDEYDDHYNADDNDNDAADDNGNDNDNDNDNDNNNDNDNDNDDDYGYARV